MVSVALRPGSWGNSLLTNGRSNKSPSQKIATKPAPKRIIATTTS
jgi:hypothetical protein